MESKLKTKSLKNGSSGSVDPEMLKHLDLLMNLPLLEDESRWELLEDFEVVSGKPGEHQRQDDEDIDDE